MLFRSSEEEEELSSAQFGRNGSRGTAAMAAATKPPRVRDEPLRARHTKANRSMASASSVELPAAGAVPDPKLQLPAMALRRSDDRERGEDPAPRPLTLARPRGILLLAKSVTPRLGLEIHMHVAPH